MITLSEIKGIINFEKFIVQKQSSYFVILKDILKLGLIEKINPKNDRELIVSYYLDNKLYYKSITEDSLLSIVSYYILMKRNNKINKIFKN